jgi:hypothetical protein
VVQQAPSLAWAEALCLVAVAGSQSPTVAPLPCQSRPDVVQRLENLQCIRNKAKFDFEREIVEVFGNE